MPAPPGPGRSLTPNPHDGAWEPIVNRLRRNPKALIRLYQQSFRLAAAAELKVRGKPMPDDPRPTLKPLCPFMPSQDPIIRSMETQWKEIGMIRHVIHKQRQQGSSTGVLGWLSWMAMFNQLINTYTAAHDKETSETLFRTVRLYHECLHKTVRPAKRRSTIQQLILENEDDPEKGLRSSMAVGTIKNVNLAIGRTLHALHFSEVARYEMVLGNKVAYAVTAAQNAVPPGPGTAIIFESTAFLTGGYFRDLCERAQRREGAWRFVFVPWFISPEYRIPLRKGEVLRLNAEERQLVRRFGLTPSQINFRRFKIAEFKGDENLFKMDFGCTSEESWITIGASIFPSASRSKLEAFLREPAETYDIFPPHQVVPVPGGPLWVWETPQPDGVYDIGIDVTSGATEAEDEAEVIENIKQQQDIPDYAAMQVVRRGTLEQVAEWQGQVDPIQLAELAACLGYWYNTAQLAPETTGMGIATNGHLNTVLRYPNMYRWRYRDRAVPKLTNWTGWDSRPRAKAYLVTFAINMIWKRPRNQPLIHSKRVFEEMGAFIRTGPDSYGHAAGKKDDMLMALLIAWVASNDEDFSRFVEGEEGHQENVEDKFYEPGKAPRIAGADPAYTDLDAGDYNLVIPASEVEGW